MIITSNCECNLQTTRTSEQQACLREPWANTGCAAAEKDSYADTAIAATPANECDMEAPLCDAFCQCCSRVCLLFMYVLCSHNIMFLAFELTYCSCMPFELTRFLSCVWLFDYYSCLCSALLTPLAFSVHLFTIEFALFISFVEHADCKIHSRTRFFWFKPKKFDARNVLSTNALPI